MTPKPDSAPSHAADAWQETHGDQNQLCWTTFDSASDGTIIISTAHGWGAFHDPGGYRETIWTRVFGGRCDGVESSFEVGQLTPNGLRRAFAEHADTIRRVADVYLG